MRLLASLALTSRTAPVPRHALLALATQALALHSTRVVAEPIQELPVLAPHAHLDFNVSAVRDILLAPVKLVQASLAQEIIHRTVFLWLAQQQTALLANSMQDVAERAMALALLVLVGAQTIHWTTVRDAMAPTLALP